jgi:hypothetical protein
MGKERISCRTLKDQAQNKGKKADQTDQALAVTNSNDGSNNNNF